MNWKLHQNKNRKRAGRIKAIVVVMVLFLLVFGAWQVLPSNAKQTVRETFVIPLELTADIRQGDTISFLKTNQQLRQENQRLQQQNLELETLVKQSQILERENQRLKTLLGKSGDRDLIYADVIAGGDRSYYNTTLINVGVQDSVEPGDLVYFDATIPVGKVVDVREDTSLIRFLSHPAETIPVVIGQDNLRASAHGATAGTLMVDLPTQVNVLEDDTVSFFGPNGVEPLGVVQEIEDSGNSFVRVYVSLLVNPSSILHLQVAK